jgi:hypothetical protein
MAGRFGFYARTGGELQSHTIDDLAITTVLTMDTARQSDTLFGHAYVGGGILHVTDNLNGQAGSYILKDLTAGVPATAFTATFNLRIGNGTGEPADGFSFNFASDLPIGATGPRPAEDGMGTGFSFCVDNYRFAPYPTGGFTNTSGMKIRYGNVDIAGVQMPAAWNSVASVPVSISVAADGALTVLVDGTNVFGAITLPWTPTAGRFGFYARTGGQNETHWVDNLAINVQTAGSPVSFTEDFSLSGAPYGTVVLNGSDITYAPAYNVCGSDAFYYLISDGQQGGFSVGTVNVFIDETIPAPPVIVICPTNRTYACTGPLPDLRGEVVAVDNCCCISVVQNPAPGTMLAQNSMTTVTFTVSDTGGRSVNCQAVITVAPSTLGITTQPASQTVFAGTTANFSVTAAGEPPFTYQWRFNGVDINGATASTLSIPNVQASNAGDYTVIVTDGCGASITSAIATLTVTPCDMLAITAQPTNTTVVEGTMATFSVTVTGTTPYTFQWFKDGVSILDATNSVYSRTVVCADSASVFTVAITNPCSQVTSSGATLTVVSGATLLQILRQGTDVVLSWPVSCSAFVLEESPSLQAPTSNWTVVSGTPVVVGGQNTLTLPVGTAERYFRLRRN